MTSIINLIQRNQAEYREVSGIQMSVILSTECSGGTLTILEKEVSVGAGSPTHTCEHEDKVILITEGNFTLYANGESYEAEKGANIFIPRGTLHSIINTGTQTGKLLITLTPAGHENFCKDLSINVKVFSKKRMVLQDVASNYNVVMA
ncbi:cupin domain-containing protein [Mucilaginibacter lutimaris]|uniref:Cupin domain-containing protein n=1 Tax=Mucilaginibacter lutimaris TaxID=931629 RepID=A0ABW2ZJL2_9SPHI